MDDLKPQRWRRRKAARPQEILTAALGVFAQKGYAGTRMDDIAQQAGVTKGTIYLYFENKEAVFKSLVRESAGAALAHAADDIAQFDGAAADHLRLAVTMIAEFVLAPDRVVLPKIIIAEAGNFPEIIRFWRNEILDRGVDLLTRVIDRGIARGEFRATVSEQTARLCLAPLLLAAFWRTTFGAFDDNAFDDQGLIATHIDILLHGLEANRGAPT